jgi:hypothetical protein
MCVKPLHDKQQFVKGTSRFVVVARNGNELHTGAELLSESAKLVCYRIWASNSNGNVTDAISGLILVDVE